MDDDTQLIFEDAPPQGLLFHYTSFDGLNGIFENKALWATNIEYLNDRTEFRHGEKIIKEAVAAQKCKSRGRKREFFKELEHRISFFAAQDVFVISMSENGDLLSQWRGYTPSSCGFNVGFDPNVLKTATWGLHKSWLVRCLYDDDEKWKFANAFLNEYSPSGSVNEFFGKPKSQSEKDDQNTFATVTFKMFVPLAMAKMKDKSFAEEKEWRLLIICNKAERVRFRMGKSLLTPYIELQWGNSDEAINPQPIRAVTIGPCPDPDLSMQSVKRFLTTGGFGTTITENSKIPFRSW